MMKFEAKSSEQYTLARQALDRGDRNTAIRKLRSYLSKSHAVLRFIDIVDGLDGFTPELRKALDLEVEQITLDIDSATTNGNDARKPSSRLEFCEQEVGKRRSKGLKAWTLVQLIGEAEGHPNPRDDRLWRDRVRVELDDYVELEHFVEVGEGSRDPEARLYIPKYAPREAIVS